MQKTGSISQAFSGLAAGSYRVAFDAAQRANYQASAQDLINVLGRKVGQNLYDELHTA